WKAKNLDLSAILLKPEVRPGSTLYCTGQQHKDVSDHLDRELIERAGAALQGGHATKIVMPVSNRHRAVGAMLSGEIARRHGVQGLPDDAVRVRLSGNAGQSFGAFLARGVTLELEGDA